MTGGLEADALDLAQASGLVADDAQGVGAEVVDDFELRAVLGVVDPLAVEGARLAALDTGEDADDGDEGDVGGLGGELGGAGGGDGGYAGAALASSSTG